MGKHINVDVLALVRDAGLTDMSVSQLHIIEPILEFELKERIDAAIAARVPQTAMMEYERIRKNPTTVENWLQKHIPDYQVCIEDCRCALTEKLSLWKTPHADNANNISEGPYYAHELLYRGDRMLRRAQADAALGLHLDAYSIFQSSPTSMFPVEWAASESELSVGLVCNSISMDHIALQNYRQALSFALQAKERLAANKRADANALAICFDNLMYLYSVIGDKEKALDSALKALVYADAPCSDETKAEIASDLRNIVCDKSKPFDDRLRFAYSLMDGKTGGKGNSFVNEIIPKLLAELYSEAGNSEQTVKFAVQYAETIKARCGESHSDTASAYLYIASCCRDSFIHGRVAEDILKTAVTYAEMASELFKNDGDTYSQGVALTIIGELYKVATHPEQTINVSSIKVSHDAHGEDTVSSSAQTKSKDSLDANLTQALEFLFSNDMRAIDCAKSMMGLLSEAYQNVVKLPQEHLRLSYLRTMKKSINLCYIIAARYPDDFAPTELYDFALKTSNVDAEIAFSLSHFYKSGASPQVKKTKATLDKLWQDRARKMANGKQDIAGIADFNKKIDDLEVKLLSLLGDESIEDPFFGISTKHIRNELDRNEALIEFVHIPIFKDILQRTMNSLGKHEMANEFTALQLPDDITDGTDYDYFCAFLVKEKKTTVKFIAAPKENIAAAELLVQGESCDNLLHSAYLSLFAPFSRDLAGVDALYIVPDGDLYRFPFELLVAPNGEQLYESFDSIVYLSSGRELLHAASRPIGDGISVIANPQYELDASAFADADDAMEDIHHSRSVDMGDSLDWKRIAVLPFTEIEGREASSLFNRVSLDTWSFATKRSILDNQTPDILHIATHGFYFDPQENSLTLDEIDENTHHETAEDYLLRFGLLFSGVRNWLRGEDVPSTYGDGIVNGCDLLDMDLSKYRLLVLSACQTGRGDTQSGEGIKGLRHSFELAGVGCIISTLWDVDDCASALLMSKFYNELLLDPDVDLSLALKHAKEYVRTITGAELAKMNWKEQLKVLYGSEKSANDAELRNKCKAALTSLHRLAAKEHPFAHPMYWAAFVLQGYQKKTNISSQDGEFSERYYDAQFTGVSDYTFANGNTYSGSWMLGRMHGKGKLTYANGSVYEGDFHEGQRTGIGTYISCDGEMYEGEWTCNKRQGSGKLTLSTGDVYEGTFLDSLFSGCGVYKSKTSDIYDGEWQSGKRHGQGKRIYSSGNTYEGEWNEDLPHGSGCLILVSGEEYRGDFCRGLRTGHGFCKYADGRTYDGEWINGEWNGQGKLVYTDGDIYEGSFSAGKFHGQGTYHWHEGGSIYEGEWLKGKRTGHGKVTWPSGNCFEGEFVNSKRCGFGRLTYADGSTFEGEWLKDKRHGHGIYRGAGGTAYEGDYLADKRDGRGTYRYSDGGTYEGFFTNDKCDGYGIRKYADGSVYEGRWKNGKRHGQGKLVFADGSVYDGEWADDVQHGHGTRTYSDGASYEGEFCNGGLSGQGVYKIAGRTVDAITFNDAGSRAFGTKEFANGDQYEGELLHGEMDGHGKLSFANGAIHEGEFLQGSRTGKGVYRLASGDEFDGTFVNGQLQGRGIYRSKNGHVYEGEFKDNNFNGHGVKKFANGDIYEGEWQDDRQHGHGKTTYAHGGSYEGDYFEGHFDGKGIYHFADGGIYEGDLKSGKFNGIGKRQYIDGSLYEGGWKDNERHGHGKLVYPDGSVFEGEFVHDEPSAQGAYSIDETIVDKDAFFDPSKRIHGEKRFANGDYYVGELLHGIMDGNGKYTLANGGTYEGECLGGKPHGYGIRHYSNGNIYEGEWKKGQRNGKGKFIYSNGGYYDGEWENNGKNGIGHQEYSDGGIYDGEWQNDNRHGEGRLVYPNGDVYEGAFENGNPHGYGVKRYANGAIYDGEWLDGKLNGKGKLVYADGAVYEGEWSEGKRHGHGILRFSNGNIYEGEWQRDQKHGKGKFTYANGGYYDGEWKDDQKSGIGYQLYTTGGTYEGEWLNGNRHGKGKHFYGDGGTYEGEWLNDKRHGNGKMIYSNDNIYEGEWSNDKKHGWGVFIYVKGGLYEGEWKDDTKHGHGKDVYTNGDTYEGDFEEGVRSGRGIYRSVENWIYEGTFQKGKKHGFGKHAFANGKSYEGEWLNDKAHGKGKRTLPDGTVQEGIWSYGWKCEVHKYSSHQNEQDNDHAGWGPEREAFTMENRPSYPVFNSIINSPIIGDERSFVRIGEISGEAIDLKKEVEIIPGKQYLIFIYFHNDADEIYNPSDHNYSGVARGARLSTTYPSTIKATDKGTIHVKITSKNSTPTEVWDSVCLTTSCEEVSLHYVLASALIFNQWDSNASVLSTNLFSDQGTYLGLNEKNGIIPGGEKYSGYVTYVLQADRSSESDQTALDKSKQ